MKLHITNGHLIDPKNNQDAPFDLLIENGKVKEILRSKSKIDGAEVIDAKDCIVAPGFVDLHTHLREPGFEYRETIESGTKAAAAGGFTSICCMANTHPVNDDASVTDYIKTKAREYGSVNVFPIGALTRGLKGKELAQIGGLKKAGCIALSDDGVTVANPRLMRLGMEYAKNFGLPVITHSIDPFLSGEGVMNESFTSTKLGLPGIPNEAEDIMIARDIYLAKLTGCQLHIAHVSTQEGVQLIKRAKQEGVAVTAEVTPHHLTLTDEAILGYRTEAKMAPPLRSSQDVEALIQGLSSGVIDAVATDHAPHAALDKEVEFDQATCGVIGLETALGICLQLVKNKNISLFNLIKSLTQNPAQIVHLSKGALGVGDEADLVIFNPKEEYIINPNHFFSKSRNTPFSGMKACGKVVCTVVGGKVVYKSNGL